MSHDEATSVANGEPVFDVPVFDVPVFDVPVFDEPVFGAPIFDTGPDDGRDPERPGRRNRGPRRPRPEPSAAQRALGLLVRREHSQRELTRKLTARGIAADEARAAVDKLRDAGWQDDSRFAEGLVRTRAAAGFGPVRIRAELATHGLSRDAIATAMDTFEGDWSELARELVGRRFGASAMEDRLVQRKAAELLLRRGFAGEHVRAATRFDSED